MGRILVIVFVTLLAACGSANGGSAPAAPTVAPRATAAPSVLPTGNPYIDNYGY